VEFKETEDGSEFLTLGRRSWRLSAASGGLDGRYGGCGSPASASGKGRARERVSLREMRQEREIGCGQCSKGSWGAWAGDVVGVLGVRAHWSTAAHEEGEADREAPRRSERKRARGGNDSVR
jgi:hypothetical protein